MTAVITYGAVMRWPVVSGSLALEMAAARAEGGTGRSSKLHTAQVNVNQVYLSTSSVCAVI